MKRRLQGSKLMLNMRDPQEKSQSFIDNNRTIRHHPVGPLLLSNVDLTLAPSSGIRLNCTSLYIFFLLYLHSLLDLQTRKQCCTVYFFIFIFLLQNTFHFLGSAVLWLMLFRQIMYTASDWDVLHIIPMQANSFSDTYQIVTHWSNK